VPSSIRDAAEEAAGRIERPARIEVIARAPGADEAMGPADAAAHADALARLFALAAAVTPDVRVVLLPKAPPWAALHVRGERMPSMLAPLPKEHLDALHAAERAIRDIGARLMLDLGGFYVQYGTFAEDE
jgi:hypothetical protein